MRPGRDPTQSCDVAQHDVLSEALKGALVVESEGVKRASRAPPHCKNWRLRPPIPVRGTTLMSCTDCRLLAVHLTIFTASPGESERV